MNGASSLVQTLIKGGVDVCFANPGTSEMHFVAALDTNPGIRCVLSMFEGCVTGAADGYARMAEKPAATLLHLGPGLGNGYANLHNARKARTPIVNIVGEHATYHRAFDSPLNSNIETVARGVSTWIRMSETAEAVGQDAADAIAAARMPPGQIATLILPADVSWNEGGVVGTVPAVPPAAKPSDEAVKRAAVLLREPGAVLVLNGAALLEHGSIIARAIGLATGARVLAQGPNPRVTRGVGTAAIDRVPNPIDPLLATFKNTTGVVLAGATPPVAQFAYPGKPSLGTPDGCEIHVLASPDQDVVGALEALAEAVGADLKLVSLQTSIRPDVPNGGAITLDGLAAVIGAFLPDQAIVTDESVTTGRAFFPKTLGAARHDWLQLTGGAIGSGIPMAIGAAVACPDRKVINFESDGSGMFTVQGLWTQAREKLNVLTVIWANRAYKVLRNELTNVRAGTPGPTALGMLSLDNPELSWVKLAQGLGVDGVRVDTIDAFAKTFADAVKRPGPYLIEVMI